MQVGFYSEHQSMGNYYVTGQTDMGEGLGQGADKRGLTGMVNEAAFRTLRAGHESSDRAWNVANV